MKFVQAPTNPTRNVLLYGGAKAGKTRGAVTAPGPLALLNADLPNATWYAHATAPGFRELEWEGWKTVVELQDGANKGTLPFRTIVVDPVNELHRLVLEELSKNAVSPSLPTYQATKVHIERFCRALCRSPHVNAVFTCHEAPVKDEATGVVEKLPASGTQNPDLGQKLMAMVDVIGYCGAVETESGPEYRAQLLTGKGRRGGDRFDALGPWRTLDLTEWFAVMDEAQAAVATAAPTQIKDIKEKAA